MSDFFTKENCCRSMIDQCVESNQGYIAILKPELLPKEHQTKEYQLVELLSGLGCKPHSFSSSCYIKICATGRQTYVDRTGLLGIADEETEEYAYKLMNPFTEEEVKFLIPIIEKEYKMFEELNQYFKDDASASLKDKWHTILAKLSTFTYQPYSKLEYNNITVSLLCSDIVESKAKAIKEKKIDPDTDPECIFMQQLYKKLYKLMEDAHE